MATVIAVSGGTATAQQIAADQSQLIGNLQNLSIEDLAKFEITSVSKQPEALSDAPAAVYVITHDDIVRAGAASLPEILRLAPNLQVMQTSPSNYVISARGFSGNTADQNFPDKLLVLIDGRSVYSPLYSGVYWDMLGVLPEDIDHIEIISGPGATIWGANAVNGVINIIRKKSADTQGGVLDVGIGNLGESASLQYGGTFGDDVAYRLYADGFYDSALNNSAGSSAHDGWSKSQGGFRVDWSPGSDLITLQGSLLSGSENQLGAPDQQITGANVQASWQHRLDGGSTLQVQAYYDQERRATDNDGGAFFLRTYDLDIQHSFALGSWNSIVWGVGDRINQYNIQDRLSSASSLLFIPDARTLNLVNVFAEDRVTVTDALQLTLGIKLEDDPFSGLAVMPSGRISWKPGDMTMFWAAVSRAVRSPTPFDVDVAEKLGSTLFLTGNPDFQPEQLTAYEFGYREQFSSRASLSISAFDNVYDDLKSIEFAPQGGLPLQWGNMMEGHVYGVEAWGSYQVNDWWRLTAGFNIQHESLRFAPGSSLLLGTAQAGDDPHHQASLRSSMNLTDWLILDADLRYVGVLPNPYVPDYVELNARLGWKVSNRLTVSLSGFNLLHAQHLEFPSSDEIQRSVFLDTRFTF